MVLDEIVKALKFIVECYRMVIHEPKLFLPSLFSMLSGLFFGVLVFIISAALVILLNVHWIFIAIIGGTLLFVSYAISYFFMGMTTYAVYEHVKLGKSSLRNAMSKSLASAPTLLVLALVTVIVSGIANSMKNRGGRRRGSFLIGMLGGVLGEVIEQGWDIASRLLVPIAVIGGLGIVDSVKKAFDIVRNNLIMVGAGVLGIKIVTGVVGFVGVIGSIAVGGMLFYVLSQVNMLLGIGVAAIVIFTGISFITTLNQFVMTSYYTLLYVWIVEGIEHGAGSTSAPEPIKAAFGV